jgi:hypothetical protein
MHVRGYAFGELDPDIPVTFRATRDLSGGWGVAFPMSAAKISAILRALA